MPAGQYAKSFVIHGAELAFMSAVIGNVLSFAGWSSHLCLRPAN
jgi:hypothetical protein